MLGSDDGVAGLPVDAAVVPGGVIVEADGVFLREEFGEEGAGVGADGLLEVGRELGELGGVDVYGDFVGLAGEVLRGVAGDGEVQADADGEEEVAVLQGEVGSAGGDGAGTADEGGLVGGDHVGGAPGGDGGNVEEVSELLELLGSRGLGGCRCRRRGGGARRG